MAFMCTANKRTKMEKIKKMLYKTQTYKTSINPKPIHPPNLSGNANMYVFRTGIYRAHFLCVGFFVLCK